MKEFKSGLCQITGFLQGNHISAHLHSDFSTVSVGTVETSVLNRDLLISPLLSVI